MPGTNELTIITIYLIVDIIRHYLLLVHNQLDPDPLRPSSACRPTHDLILLARLDNLTLLCAYLDRGCRTDVKVVTVDGQETAARSGSNLRFYAGNLRVLKKRRCLVTWITPLFLGHLDTRN